MSQGSSLSDIDWAVLAGFGDTTLIPRLLDEARGQSREALRSLEQLSHIAEHQQSATQITPVVLPFIEALAQDAPRESVRRGAFGFVSRMTEATSLARTSGVGTTEAGLSESDRYAAQTRNAAAAALGRLGPLVDVRSTEVILDHCWLELAVYADAEELFSMDEADGRLPTDRHCLRRTQAGWHVYFSTGEDTIAAVEFVNVADACERFQKRVQNDPGRHSFPDQLQGVTFRLALGQGHRNFGGSGVDYEALSRHTGLFFNPNVRSDLTDWIAAVAEDPSVSADLRLFGRRALGTLLHAGVIVNAQSGNNPTSRRKEIEARLRTIPHPHDDEPD